ncbi:MAG: hypothetical protein WC975_06550 [Phycisphaerae bacterium]
MTARKKGKFGRKRVLAIEALLTTATVQAAAYKSGVSESTLYRWLKDDDFQKEFLKARRQVFGQAVARLQGIAMKAVNILEAILDDSECPSYAKLGAAKTVLELGRQGIQDDDLLVRIENLERILEESKP